MLNYTILNHVRKDDKNYPTCRSIKMLNDRNANPLEPHFFIIKKNAGQPYNDYMRNLMLQCPLLNYFSNRDGQQFQGMTLYMKGFWM